MARRTGVLCVTGRPARLQVRVVDQLPALIGRSSGGRRNKPVYVGFEKDRSGLMGSPNDELSARPNDCGRTLSIVIGRGR